MENINNIYIVAPIVFGLVIGWIVFYFIRQYKEYNVTNLKQTASAFIGGAGFCSLPFFADASIGSISIMCYLLGCGLGCILHLFLLLSAKNQKVSNNVSAVPINRYCGFIFQKVSPPPFRQRALLLAVTLQILPVFSSSLSLGIQRRNMGLRSTSA